MKEWGRDFDKFGGFGSDETLTMISKQNRVVRRFKKKSKSFRNIRPLGGT